MAGLEPALLGVVVPRAINCAALPSSPTLSPSELHPHMLPTGRASGNPRGPPALPSDSPFVAHCVVGSWRHRIGHAALAPRCVRGKLAGRRSGELHSAIVDCLSPDIAALCHRRPPRVCIGQLWQAAPADKGLASWPSRRLPPAIGSVERTLAGAGGIEPPRRVVVGIRVCRRRS